MKHPAIFLDRDRTLIDDPGFITDPDQVKLMDGVPEALRRLEQRGFRVVVVTNQSGVARGLLDETRLGEIHERLMQLLEDAGAGLDGIYYCPYLPGEEAVVESYRLDSDLRKPKPGMLLKAAGELQLDLERSWMIGDSARDIQAGRAAGCKTILVNGQERAGAAEDGSPDFVASDLLQAADIIEKHVAIEPSKGMDSRTLETLTDIRNILDRQHRASRQEDFSLRRLSGTLVQMLALVMALWGVVGLLTEAGATQVIGRLLLGTFLQLLALTMSLADKRE